MAPVDKHPTFQIRHRRRSSSVADNNAAGQAARRVRRLSVGSRRAPPGLLERLLERPQVFVGALCAAVFLLGTAISIYYDTAVQTSEIHHVHNVAPLRTAYFARKSNFFNQMFVKRAWAWTVAIYLLHLSTSPGAPSIPSSAAAVGKINPALHSLPHITPRRSRGQRLAAIVLASLAWILFTAWCFGAGLGDRIIAASGGTCSVPLPQGVVDVGALEPLLPEGHTTMILHAAPHDPHVVGGAPRGVERVYLPLEPDFCARRLKLDTSTHPRLFDLLHDAHEEIHRALHLQPPRWSGGFDVSGHAFLLTLGTIVLAAEIAPSWRAALAERRGLRAGGAGRGIKGIIHVLSTVAGTALIGLWLWMLFTTAVYFHDTHEKLAGLGLGLTAALLVNLCIPGHASPVIEFKVRGAPRRPRVSPLGADGEDDDDLPPLSPVFIRSSPPSSDEAPLSPTPVRTPPMPTLRQLDAVALLEQEARRPRIVVDEGHLHQE